MMKKIALSLLLALGTLTSTSSAGNGLEHGEPCKKTAACESGLVCRLPETTNGGQMFCLPELPPDEQPEEAVPGGSFFVLEADPGNTYTCPGAEATQR
jgi:hypothetical protein